MELKEQQERSKELKTNRITERNTMWHQNRKDIEEINEERKKRKVEKTIIEKWNIFKQKMEKEILDVEEIWKQQFEQIEQTD